MEVQVFGVKSDADTRKALRFFRERRVRVHFVDFKQRQPSKGELRRFLQRFGEDRLINRSARRFEALGLRAAYFSEDRWLEIACDEPLILRMPLVRHGSRLTVGHDEASWKEWMVA